MRKPLAAAAIAAFALACGNHTSTTNTQFSIAASPGTLSVLSGEDAYLLVTIDRAAGFTSRVTLHASGLPSGSTVTALPMDDGATSAALVFHGGATLTTGASVAVTATAGDLTSTTTLQLSVTAPPSGGTKPALVGLVFLDFASSEPTGFSNPTGIAVNPTTGKVYMVNDQNGGLAVYDPGANTLGVLSIPSAQRVAVDSSTGTVYAVGGTSNLIVVKGATVSQVNVGGALEGVAVDSSTGQVFVADNVSHAVSQIEGASLRVQPGSWQFPGDVEGPVAVDERRHTVYASIYGGVGIINEANGDSWSVPLDRVNSTLTEAPVDISVDPRNGQAYMLGSDGFNGSDGWIHLLDDTYLPNSTSITATNAPSSLAIDSGTNKLYVADSANQSVNVLDLNTGAFLTQIMIPKSTSGGMDEGPIGVAVDPSTHRVYATMRYYDSSPAVAVIDGR